MRAVYILVWIWSDGSVESDGVCATQPNWTRDRNRLKKTGKHEFEQTHISLDQKPARTLNKIVQTVARSGVSRPVRGRPPRERPSTPAGADGAPARPNFQEFSCSDAELFSAKRESTRRSGDVSRDVCRDSRAFG